MSAFDVAVAIDQTTLNQIIATLYGRPGLRNSLFAGTQTTQAEGVNLTVSYSVLQPPTVLLTPPSPQQWQAAIKQDGSVPQPVANALMVHFPQVKVGKQSPDGSVQETQVAFDAICTVSLAGMALSITPLAVIVDLSGASAIDKVIYRYVIIPRVLAQVGTMLSGKQLPSLNFQGLQFGPPLFQFTNGRLVIVGNLANKPAPTAVPPINWPGSPFAVMLSPEAMQLMANTGTQPLVGRQTGTSGSEGFGIGTANYSASVRLTQISANVDPGNLTTVHANIGLGISASAGVDIFGEITKALSSY